MSRLMSVALTTNQVEAHTKTVTRRLGWLFLKPGDTLTLCRKVQGRRKGEPLDRLAEVEVLSVGLEVLGSIHRDEVRREGFPDWSPVDFVSFFCDSMHVTRFVEVNRIEWRYLDGKEPIVDADGKPVGIAIPKDEFLEADTRRWFAGRVPAKDCGHYMTTSEVKAGFTKCEQCS